MNFIKENIISQQGTCPICEKQVLFSSREAWFRDHLLCSSCGSIPRERALMRVIAEFFPDWRNLAVHESSPGGRGASIKLHSECNAYTASHYFSDVSLGHIHPQSGFRCENLENLTFQDESFDLFVTQDVMEHIFDPGSAFREIARVLKPGGAHIFTVPLINKARSSEVWASRNESGQVVHHHMPEYHGNPIDQTGSLVTMHWGYDIAAFILKEAQMPSIIMSIDDMNHGIRAEYIEVLVSMKNSSDIYS